MKQHDAITLMLRLTDFIEAILDERENPTKPPIGPGDFNREVFATRIDQPSLRLVECLVSTISARKAKQKRVRLRLKK